MTTPLFRKVALERLSTPDQLDRAMRVTSPSGWLGLAALLVLVAGGLVWGVVGTAPVKVGGHGILLSPSGVLDIVSESQGRIQRLLVGPRDIIARDQVVALVSQPDLQQKLDTVRAEHAEQVIERDRIRAFHIREDVLQHASIEQRRSNAAQSASFLADRLKWLMERETYEVDMVKRGLITRQRHLDTKIEINTVHEGIARAENTVKDIALEEDNLKIGKERELLAVNLKIEAAQRDIANLADQLRRRTELRSPYAGVVAEVKVNEGELVNLGTSVLSLLPPDTGRTGDAAGLAGNLVAVLYAAPTEGKKVRAGMPVQIAPATVKRQEYGFMLGTVEEVAEIPSTSAGMLRILKNNRLVESLMGEGAPFQITVRLHRDPVTPSGFRWSSSRGPNTDVDSGTLCEGVITVRDIRLISLAIPALEPLFGEAAHAAQPRH
jgi:HlyD family secretion protein